MKHPYNIVAELCDHLVALAEKAPDSDQSRRMAVLDTSPISPEIDQAWRMAVLYTKPYADACNGCFGRVIAYTTEDPQPSPRSVELGGCEGDAKTSAIPPEPPTETVESAVESVASS